MGKASKSKQNKKPVAYKQPKDRFALWVSLATAVVAAIIIVIVVITTTNVNKQSNVDASTTTPNGVVNDGFVINKDGLVPAEPTSIDTALAQSTYDSTQNNISLYIDYACPHCAEFEEANIGQLENWLKDGTVDTVTIHPISFLTQYSVDGANALSCVANYEPTRILEAHKLLISHHADPLSPAKISNMLKDNGYNMTDEFNTCIRGGEYENFILKATERAQTGPIPQSTGVATISGTPTVLVNGQRYPQAPTDAEAFKAFALQTFQTVNADQPTVSE